MLFVFGLCGHFRETGQLVLEFEHGLIFSSQSVSHNPVSNVFRVKFFFLFFAEALAEDGITKNSPPPTILRLHPFVELKWEATLAFGQ